ncbi:MAG: hypothetical protein EOO52_15050 [Gammaproteobacteria bacterium]|nr:MAG: hypothetical protein EOO52_15050 [Gammaproteobacteria bacterium]
MNIETASANSQWLYLKLYLGEAVDKMDALLIDIGKKISSVTSFEQWFFIRYIDEGGMHIRLRAKPSEGQYQQAKNVLDEICLERLNKLHDYVPSEYYPMVSQPGSINFRATDVAHNDVRVAYEQYLQETDKYGTGEKMLIAESIFAESSKIACEILALEDNGIVSRKTFLPSLMQAAYDAFKPTESAAGFWKHYALYWLGGDTPVAQDWRERFTEKAEELKSEGINLFAAEENLPEQAQALIARWRKTLNDAATRYAKANGDLTSNDVLTFNFAHLMNNRLGLMALEEAYMACLLEAQ